MQNILLRLREFKEEQKLGYGSFILKECEAIFHQVPLQNRPSFFIELNHFLYIFEHEEESVLVINNHEIIKLYKRIIGDYLFADELLSDEVFNGAKEEILKTVYLWIVQKSGENLPKYSADFAAIKAKLKSEIEDGSLKIIPVEILPNGLNYDHPGYSLSYRKDDIFMEADIDENLVVMITRMWKLGLKTVFSCKGDPARPYSSYIDFSSVNDAISFLNLISQDARGKRLIQNGIFSILYKTVFFSEIEEHFLDSKVDPLYCIKKLNLLKIAFHSSNIELIEDTLKCREFKEIPNKKKNTISFKKNILTMIYYDVTNENLLSSFLMEIYSSRQLLKDYKRVAEACKYAFGMVTIEDNAPVLSCSISFANVCKDDQEKLRNIFFVAFILNKYEVIKQKDPISGEVFCSVQLSGKIEEVLLPKYVNEKDLLKRLEGTNEDYNVQCERRLVKRRTS